MEPRESEKKNKKLNQLQLGPKGAGDSRARGRANSISTQAEKKSNYSRTRMDQACSNPFEKFTVTILENAQKIFFS